MATGSLIFVFAIGSALALLAILQFFLATRHDHAISLAGPLEEERAVQARINEKRATLVDIDEELRKRREALQDLARLSADVEDLQRRRDELLAEWQQLEERRNEVYAVRADLEEVRNDKLAVDAELAEAKSKLEDVRARLEKAEALGGEVSLLTEQRDKLLREIDSLRDEWQKYVGAKGQVGALEARARELESDSSKLNQKIETQKSQLADLETQVSARRETLTESESKLTGLKDNIAAAAAEAQLLRQSKVGLEQDRVALEARKAVLEREIGELEGKGKGEPGGSDDPLRELKSVPPVISVMQAWKESRVTIEVEALKRVSERFAALGLEYPARTLRAFHTAMKVNETSQIAVLAGISGTGKSQLPRQYAAGIGIGFLQVPVQPRWDSPQDLMGFYNYIESRFRPTDLCRALYALDEQNNDDAVRDRMLLILLDEMNLARIEYYFSDFLSRLESRPRREDVGSRDARKDAEIELEVPRMEQPPRIFPGYNLSGLSP